MSSTAPGPLFRLLPTEDWGTGFSRLLAQQLALAQSELRLCRHGVDEAVHTARKACKRIRAVLRLLRGALGEETFEAENRAVRDAARRLSNLRDARVALETAAALRQRAQSDPAGLGATPTAVDLEPFWQRFEGLLAERLVHERQCAEREGALQAAHDELAAASRRVAVWRTAGDPVASAAHGLRAGYERGRELYRLLLEEDDDERFHAWRKVSKRLLHHLTVLRVFQSGSLLVMHNASRKLCQCLGEINDLAVLRGRLTLLDGRVEDEALAGARRILDRYQARIKDTARRHGAQIYWRDPDALLVAFGFVEQRPAQHSLSLPGREG